MNSEERNFELIEDYLKGKLQGDDLKAFEDAIKENQQLQNQVAVSRLANDLIIANRLQEVKTIFQEEHAANTKNLSWWKGGITGLITISIIGLMWLFFFSENENKNIQKESLLLAPGPNKDIVTAHDEDVHKNSEKKPSGKKIPGNNKKVKVKKVEPGLSESPNIIQPEKEIEILTQDSETRTIDKVSDPEITGIPETPIDAKKSENDPCAEINIQASTSVKSACKNKADGEIIISSIKGGESPYQFTITSLSDKTATSEKLKAGIYNLTITDSHGCEKTLKEISVPEKICLIDYHFNPYYAEEWTIPTNNLSGRLFVYDNAGNVYYEKQTTGYGIETWNGESMTGIITPGFYLFVIKNSDGTEVQGTITITQ